MMDMLDKWLAESSMHFNIFVGSQMALALLSVGVLIFFSHRLGKADERTDAIRYKIVSAMFYALIIANGLFISLVDADMHYFRQYLISCNVLAIFVGAIMSAYYYFQESK